MTHLLIMPPPNTDKPTTGSSPRLTAKTADRHKLYEAAVQCVEADLDFFARVYKGRKKKPLRILREDFCGTAALAVEWVRRHKNNQAWGVDLHRPTLDWGVKNNACVLDQEQGERLHLICDNVLKVTKPKVDIVAALNFSYSVFMTRQALLQYFKVARKSLNSHGMFFLDCFGGSDAMESVKENRTIPKSKGLSGARLPSFTYVWEQVKFNPIDHRLLAHIHFRFNDGTMMKKAFTYDWRLWTLPELQELMREAGFRNVDVYLEGWDDDADEADGIFRRRTQAENIPGWVGYVVGEV